MLAPETNGSGGGESPRRWSELTGRDHTHLATNKEKIRFRDIQAQPRKIISSPTRVWSGR
ncbi:hypothetical protein KCP70_25555 [Salmonella enterica subsp. enterica]|nr:hypothetical protein KCP70_25555 [Salmonella enterica subsp. enterica]